MQNNPGDAACRAVQKEGEEKDGAVHDRANVIFRLFRCEADTRRKEIHSYQLSPEAILPSNTPNYPSRYILYTPQVVAISPRRRRNMRPRNIIAILSILSSGAVDAQSNGEWSGPWMCVVPLPSHLGPVSLSI